MIDDGETPGAVSTAAANETDLCRVWATGHFAAGALVASDGSRLEIIYPGQRNGLGGPDFRGALIADASGRVRAGAIEVHLRSRDWIGHGHRVDPAYNDVILHVVLEDDGSPCLRPDGTPVPVLCLAPWLDVPLSAAQASPAHNAQPCRVAPSLSFDEVRAIVRRAADARLDAKAAALEAQIAALGPEQALFTALLDAAGYSRNRVPCALLAERLPVERLYDLVSVADPSQANDIAAAIVLGLAGLLPHDPAHHLNARWSRYVDLWPLPPLRTDAWTRAGVRPANRPESRLYGVALLAARCARPGLVASLLAPLRDQHLTDAHAAAALVAGLTTPVPGEGGPAMIGQGRGVEMAINVLVPFAMALSRGHGASRVDTALPPRARRVAAALPSGGDAEPLRQMRALLASSGHRLRAAGALEQQGLLHLYRAHCALHACWECPLAGSGG